jgi:hypothetical protein
MKFFKKITDVFVHLAQEMRWSYVPPLMIYFAAGISGFTGIIEGFYVKDELGLTAEFLAGLAFWAGIPWALKMPVGHMVDLFWRWKSIFVFIGATMMATSITIMIFLTGEPEWMKSMWSLSNWYILSALLSPVGFVLQDVVADAMTVEAVPATDEEGNDLAEDVLRRMHVNMQTLGRRSIMFGIALVSGIGGWLAEVYSYNLMYTISIVVPIISVCGVLVGFMMKRKQAKKLRENGVEEARIFEIIHALPEKISANWWILGGSAIYVVFTIGIGLSEIAFSQEIIFIGSMAIIAFLIRNLIQDLPTEKKVALISMAIIIFAFRAMPSSGAGASWWQIDVLGFNESFMGTLRQISAILAIFGMFALREWMQTKPMHYFVVFLTLLGAVLFLPFIGMFYGLHEWTQEVFGFGARTIAIVDTMADAPFGQVAMIPMLAWIAMEAPKNMKATYFAVMAAFTNLALSASSLGTKYLNQIFTITREVEVDGVITTQADYSELGMLMITVAIITLVIPIFTVYLLHKKIK